MTSGTMIACPGCGQKYAWKPQLEGKQVRCRCGQTFAVSAQGAATPDDMGPAEEYGVGSSAAVPQRPPTTIASARCPSCGSALPPNARICVACGLNLRTGERAAGVAGASPPPATAAKTPAPPLNPYGVRSCRPAQDPDDSSATRRKVIVASVLLVLVVAASIAAVIVLGNKDPKMVPRGGDDERVIKRINDYGATEIREWLNNNPSHRRLVMGMTDQQALGVAEQLYEMGAVRVLAFGEVMTASLAVELPDAPPESRTRLLDWYNRNYRRPDDPLADKGQLYLLIPMHL
jgi:hypothetical protein